jgi:CheY-like chemotaxis protein
VYAGAVNLLHLEDDANDLELFAVWCRDQWPECSMTPARDRDTYIAALRSGQFTGIVSDSGLHNLTGAEAVALARAYAPALPFVFLCGAMSPEKKAELTAAKPDALVSKDDPKAVREIFMRLFRT